MKITILPYHQKEYKTFHIGFEKDLTFSEFEELVIKQSYNTGTYKADFSITREYEGDRRLKYIKFMNKFRDEYPKENPVLKIHPNFIEKIAIELDYDGGFSLENALSLFRNYKHIIGTTKSHRVKKEGKIEDRFRVILFFNRPCKSRDEHIQIYDGLNKKLKIPLSDDRSRLVEQPWLPFQEVVSSNEFGLELDIDELVSIAPVRPKPTILNPDLFPVLENKLPLKIETQELLTNGIANLPKDKYFHKYFFSACIDLKKCGYSQEEAIELLQNIPHTRIYKTHNFQYQYLGVINKIYAGYVAFYGKKGDYDDELDYLNSKL